MPLITKTSIYGRIETVTIRPRIRYRVQQLGPAFASDDGIPDCPSGFPQLHDPSIVLSVDLVLERMTVRSESTGLDNLVNYGKGGLWELLPRSEVVK